MKLIVSSLAEGKISATEEAEAFVLATTQAALAAESVQTPEERVVAVEAMSVITEAIKKIEESRKDAKEPILKLGREIDRVAAELSDRIVPHKTRIKHLLQAYDDEIKRQHIEEERRIAEEARKLEEMRIALAEEEKRQQEAAAAPELGLEEALESAIDLQTRKQELQRKQDKILDSVRANAVAAMESAPAKKGYRSSKRWEFDVTDVHALYKSHRQCVTLTPVRSAISDLLKAGIVPEGVSNAREVLS